MTRYRCDECDEECNVEMRGKSIPDCCVLLGGNTEWIKSIILSQPPKPLSSAMDNVDAWRLGEVAQKAGGPSRKDVGDYIDRGLILRRLLEEKGYLIIKKEDR